MTKRSATGAAPRLIARRLRSHGNENEDNLCFVDGGVRCLLGNSYM